MPLPLRGVGLNGPALLHRWRELRDDDRHRFLRASDSQTAGASDG